VNAPNRDEESLSAEISALRSALREVRAPDDELALRSAARARGTVHAAAPDPRAARQSIFAAAHARIVRRHRPLAVAAAAIVVAVVVFAMRVERVDRADGAQRAAAAPDAAQPVMAVPVAQGASPMFRPISFPRRLSSAESYSVVRVRLELATSVPGAGAPNAAIEADLLIGEDGLARAIRFDSADTLPVYAASGPASGERR
jgi:hypothetical protein